MATQRETAQQADPLALRNLAIQDVAAMVDLPDSQIEIRRHLAGSITQTLGALASRLRRAEGENFDLLNTLRQRDGLVKEQAESARDVRRRCKCGAASFEAAAVHLAPVLPISDDKTACDPKRLPEPEQLAPALWGENAEGAGPDSVREGEVRS